MTTTEAIKFCFSADTYQAIQKHSSPPELLKIACLYAFKNLYANFPVTSMHWQVGEKLRNALTTLEQSGRFEE